MKRKDLPSGRIRCELASAVQQRSQSPLPAVQGGTSPPDTECYSHSIRRETNQDPGGSTPPSRLHSHPPFTRHQSLHAFLPRTPSRDSYQSVCVLKLLWVHRGSWGLSQILHCAACLKEDSTGKAPKPARPRPLLCTISFLPPKLQGKEGSQEEELRAVGQQEESAGSRWQGSVCSSPDSHCWR